MKRAIVLFLLFSLIGGVASADTGTYRILDYKVSLTPHSDGTVDIEYYQKWLVTGGDIPWITVGTPNENFEILEHSGAVSRITLANQGGWSGVRLDLDRDYLPNQVFEIYFTISQNNLFYADKESYRLEFTPGWYDRAITDTLRITVKFFAKLETVKTNPQPSWVSGEEMIWVKNNLGNGERFSISVSFPKKLFPAEVGKGNLNHSSSAGNPAFVIVLIIVFVVGAMVARAFLFPGARGYSGGRIFYGTSDRGGFGGGRSTGGGGGFGGRSVSCACACVSCACACACAGGGGAGCSRKTQHVCPLCKNWRRQ
jgi:hypothetical protein